MKLLLLLKLMALSERRPGFFPPSGAGSDRITVKLSCETHEPVECGGALFTAATRLYPHRVGYPLDGVAQTRFLLDKEPGKPNPMNLALSFILVVLGFLASTHRAFSCSSAAAPTTAGDRLREAG